jgi:hypothetical protein
MGFHGLLLWQLSFFICRWCSYLRDTHLWASKSCYGNSFIFLIAICVLYLEEHVSYT